MRIGLFCIGLLCALAPRVCYAGVERFAVVVGNNHGSRGDTPLRYAEADATRVYDVLRDLGGFQPVNMVLLKNEPAETLRRTLITVNARIRSALAVPNGQALLFVYYSGHADADELHLGDTRFGVSELVELARGSAASFRLVVLDACRSGALTRSKGGRIRAPFALPAEKQLGDGMALLTASSLNEDAQESDELRGSFFTHAFVSGLLGAADNDHDGSIALDEAYQYAYQATLRATSSTLSGAQHPTYRYDFRGEGHVVLTRPEYYAQQRAALSFPAALAFLVMLEDANGSVVAELSDRSEGRTLSLRPGRYFVRGRGPDVLYEGRVSAASGVVTQIDVASLDRIAYARLVRKGQSSVTLVQRVEAGARTRSALPNAATACNGLFLGYGMDFEHFGARARIGACTSSFESGNLRAVSNAYDAEARVYRGWDFGAFFIELGLGGGVSVFTQRFRSAGSAPGRNTATPLILVGGAAGIALPFGLYAALDLTAETHFIPLQQTAIDPAETRVAFALRAGLAVGKQF